MDDGQGAFGMPVLPETYDWQREGMIMPHLRAFGAGAVDPFGLTKLGLGAFGYGHQARRLQEMQAESPAMSELAGVVTPGMGYAKAAGLTLKELGGALPYLMSMGAGWGGIRQELAPVREAPRAQGSYPPKGAY
jgi:hypothetical protein